MSWKLDIFFFFLGSFGFDGPNFSFPDLDMEGKIYGFLLGNLYKKKFIEEYELGAHFLLLTWIVKPLYFLKWRPIFDNFCSTERKT